MQNKEHPEPISFPGVERRYPVWLRVKSWAAQVAYVEEDLAISMLFRLVGPEWKTQKWGYGKHWVHGGPLKSADVYRACHNTGRCRGEGKPAMVFEPEQRPRPT